MAYFYFISLLTPLTLPLSSSSYFLSLTLVSPILSSTKPSFPDLTLHPRSLPTFRLHRDAVKAKQTVCLHCLSFLISSPSLNVDKQTEHSLDFSFSSSLNRLVEFFRSMSLRNWAVVIGPLSVGKMWSVMERTKITSSRKRRVKKIRVMV